MLLPIDPVKRVEQIRDQDSNREQGQVVLERPMLLLADWQMLV